MTAATQHAANPSRAADGTAEAGEDVPTIGDLMHTEAQMVVRGNVIAAMAIGLVPVPVAGVIAVSVRMVHGLSQIYDVPFSSEAARAALIAIIPSALPVAAMGVGGSFLKSIPGLGSIVGGGGVSLLSGAVVYALGQVFIRHYESGGALSDLNLDLARRQFRAALEEGRRVVPAIRERGQDGKAHGTADTTGEPAATAATGPQAAPHSTTASAPATPAGHADGPAREASGDGPSRVAASSTGA